MVLIVLRKAIGKQLNYIKRDLGYIDTLVRSGKCLSEKEIDILKVIKEVYAQQKEMFDNHKRDRNAAEGKFGEGKRAYGLNRIFAKLK